MPSTVSPDIEPIDVRRIRLTQAAGACAVVSEFRTADQVLARWIDRERSSKARQFAFEITFVDGYTLCGCYEFWRGARRRPSLTRFVRTIFHAMAAPGAGAVDLSRYAIDAL
jgi:hypothetical protein